MNALHKNTKAFQGKNAVWDAAVVSVGAVPHGSCPVSVL